MRISDWNSDVCSSDLRDAVPTVQVAVSFDAGYAADPHGALGTQSLMLSLMDEGTTRLDSIAFAEAKERLGAQIDGSANADETIFSLFALTPNLRPSLALLADYIRKDRKSTRLNSSH